MKTLITAATAALGLIVGVAAADAANTANTTTPQGTMSANAPGQQAKASPDASSTQTTMSANAEQGQHGSLRQQLQSQLSSAGFTDIKIMPSSFYIQAKDKKGNAVAMVVGPDSFTEVTQVGGNSASASAQQTPNPSSGAAKSPSAPNANAQQK